MAFGREAVVDRVTFTTAVGAASAFLWGALVEGAACVADHIKPLQCAQDSSQRLVGGELIQMYRSMELCSAAGAEAPLRATGAARG